MPTGKRSHPSLNRQLYMSNINLSDRRVKRTNKALADALINASLEKGYDNVAIKDITDRADVAYSTFFRHYHNKDELLLEILGNLMDTMRRLMRQHPKSSPEQNGHILFRHVQQNASFYRVLLSSQTTNGVLWRFQRMIEQELLNRGGSESPQLVAPEAAIPAELLVHHFIVSIVTMIGWWLDHNQTPSVEHMARYYSKLIVEPLQPHFGAPLHE